MRKKIWVCGIDMAKKKRNEGMPQPVQMFPLLAVLYLIGVGIATLLYAIWRQIKS